MKLSIKDKREIVADYYKYRNFNYIHPAIYGYGKCRTNFFSGSVSVQSLIDELETETPEEKEALDNIKGDKSGR